MLSQTVITSKGSFQEGRGGGKAEALRRSRWEWRRRRRKRRRCEGGRRGWRQWKNRQQEDISIQPSTGQLHLHLQLLPLCVLVVLLLLLHHAVCCRPHRKHLGSGCVPVNLLQLLPELVQVDLARGRDLARQSRPQKLPRLPFCCPPQLLMSFQAHLGLVWCWLELVSAKFGLVVHKVGRQALPDLDAGARLPGWEWRPKEASAERACANPMARTRGEMEGGLVGAVTSVLWWDLRAAASSWRVATTTTGGCGRRSQQTWHLTLVAKAGDEEYILSLVSSWVVQLAVQLNND